MPPREPAVAYWGTAELTPKEVVVAPAGMAAAPARLPAALATMRAAPESSRPMAALGFVFSSATPTMIRAAAVIATGFPVHAAASAPMILKAVRTFCHRPLLSAALMALMSCFSLASLSMSIFAPAARIAFRLLSLST